MLNRVEIENFKAIEKLSMDFTSRLTVIVGPNGSGKTSILDAISSFGGQSNGARSASFRRLGMENGTESEPWVHIFTETAGVLFDPINPSIRSRQSFDGDSRPSDIPNCALYHFDYARMSQPSLEGSWLDSDGSNISAVLAGLKLNNPEKFSVIETSLRAIIPQIVRLRFAQVPIAGLKLLPTFNSQRGSRPNLARPSTANGFQLLFDTTGANGIPADSASEGTLLTLGIITRIVMAESRLENVVMLDDVDASLHPAAQRSLVVAIRELLEHQPKLQLITTSHSPYLLDSLTHDEIRLTTLDDQGRVVCGTLMDHPDFERWKDEMTPGEMWSMFGEKWLTSRAEVVAETTP